MNLAHQVDEAFEPNAPVSYHSAQQYLMSDKKFGRRKAIDVKWQTGLEEVPNLVLTTNTEPAEGLLVQLQQMIERFKELKALEAGWDSYSGRRVHRSAIAPAMQVVIDSLLKCKTPRIDLNSSGGIDLRWEEDDRDLSMSVDGNGRFEVLYESAGGEVMEPTELLDLEHARSFIERLCAGQ